ncbi:AAA family ATPase [Streptomyces sp. NPDC048483]|uniref:AAA family ATPase n=1 Tax=Streptomyces sp. NPDC048483 TaxID=3154927 RepID=UPI003432B7F5
MHLRQLGITNFRSRYDVDVEFQPDITLLVGENNSGKSDVIEALRPATTPLNRRSTRWFDEADLIHGRETQEPQFKVTYDGLTQVQRAHYIASLDVGNQRATYTTMYRRDAARQQMRPSVTAGPVEGPDSEPEKRDQIAHVYLTPLRDAQRELDSSDGNRLLRIIRYLTTEDEQEDFRRAANASLREVKGHGVLTSTTTEIQGHLGQLTESVRGQTVEVAFAEYELHRLARSLRIKMAEAGIPPTDLTESGLGYANLLFIATVILELRKAQDSLFAAACPGAGKTRAMVARFLKRTAEENRRGVALISFTNAAVEEARRHFGYQTDTLRAPHFVGAFDTIIHRFLVTPLYVKAFNQKPNYEPDGRAHPDLSRQTKRHHGIRPTTSRTFTHASRAPARRRRTT